MNKNKMLEAIQALDDVLPVKGKLLLGGGGAMVLAYNFPLATQDLDALFYKSDVTEADVQGEIESVAQKLNLPHDWLNAHFQTFLYTLPADYESRLISVYAGKNLSVNALSLTDLLILKCFAGREKDIPHARALLKKGADSEIARKHINELIDKGLPKASLAADFLDDLLDELE